MFERVSPASAANLVPFVLLTSRLKFFIDSGESSATASRLRVFNLNDNPKIPTAHGVPRFGALIITKCVAVGLPSNCVGILLWT